MNARALRDFLRRGGLIAYPTESCYGLGCDPRHPHALHRLVRIKGRDAAKGLLLIGASFSQLAPFIRPLPRRARARLARTWPGPVTWVVPAARHVHPLVTGSHDTIGVRVTAHPDAARLCRELGTALVSTSANRSGKKPARTAAQCRSLFGSRVHVIDGRIGRRRRPSTLIDLATGNVLRP